jgi:hypothetical protein
VHLGGDLQGDLHVLGSAWDDHAEGFDLIDAGVGAVQAAAGAVEANLALDVSAEVAFEGGAALFVVIGAVSGGGGGPGVLYRGLGGSTYARECVVRNQV